MLRFSIPTFRVSASRRAESFYCGKLGFRLDAAHRGTDDDPCYLGVSRDGVLLHLSSLAGEGPGWSSARIVCDDVDALHREFTSRNVAIHIAPVNQTWGAREMYVKDPDGNTLCFQQWEVPGAELASGSELG
jgi:catechol 2,3-dioxygenase-like lactoylglutathione lyase family enzyme